MVMIRTAVIGVGYLGRYHAEKYKNLPNSKLVAVCDTNHERCYELAKELNVEAVVDYKSLIGQVDAVSIVVPTPLHHQVARFFLDNGIHVLIEKPIATTIEEADDLITTAKKNGLKLQVGHLERFNNAVKAVERSISNPRFIESLRVAPFKLRGADVNVVLDLMIHDIDIIQSIVKSEIHHITANGASILTPYIDIANARIEFANGCVANVTASRVSLRMERKLHIFQPDNYISLDLDHKKIRVHRKGSQEMFPGIPEITREVHYYEKGDALLDQSKSFLDAIIQDKTPTVTGEDGKRALATALEITLIVRRSNEQTPIPELTTT
ncbi:Gfo/Idh/MocA family oxidoreductase [Candidiatus Paracoxiella cheracis]|uniref:Gfo/Idh/MocA family oxidoreductase n=1 Tax=Candidiatus Paracoxiella cheracis TaxID=3405120 RepID=UPI003BF58F13